jgi:hypothetical protein
MQIRSMQLKELSLSEHTHATSVQVDYLISYIAFKFSVSYLSH